MIRCCPAIRMPSFWELITEEGRRCLWTRMACHPTVLNGDNLELTADFPGALEACFDCGRNGGFCERKHAGI